MGTNTAQKGYVLLISVLIIGAVGTTIVSSVLLAGVDASRSSLTIQQSAQVQALAHSCASEATHRLQRDAAYADSEPYTLNLGDGSCTIASIVEASGVYTVDLDATVGTITRAMQIQIDPLDPFTVTAWGDTAQ